MGIEQRKHPRVSGYAKALLLGSLIPGYIRDLSRSGCQVAFMQAVQVAEGDLVAIRIIAEHDPSIPPFEVRLRVRWIKPDAIWHAFGGEIVQQENAEAAGVFDKLVDYYSGTNT